MAIINNNSADFLIYTGKQSGYDYYYGITDSEFLTGSPWGSTLQLLPSSSFQFKESMFVCLYVVCFSLSRISLVWRRCF